MALFQRFKSRYAEHPPQWEEVPRPGPRSVGDLLRQRREALGLALDDAATALRIKPSYLRALEDGEPDRLPGPAYAVGFLRSYGDHLGLDSQEVLRRFKAVSSALDNKPDLSFPMPLGEASIPGGTMLLVAAILVLCGYGTWYYLSTAERSRLEPVAAVPAALLPPPAPASLASSPGGSSAAASPAAAPADSTAPQPTVAEAAPAASTVAAGGAPAEAPASPGPEKGQPAAAAELVPGLMPASLPGSAATAAAPATAAAVPPPAPATAAAVPPPATAAAAPAAPQATQVATAEQTTAAQPAAGAQREAPHAYGAVGTPARIVLIATADSWVQVRDSDGTPLFSRVLKPGESYRVPERPGLTMQTGNAGGLEITLDGKALPSLGKSGAIRRGIKLDPQALTSTSAARE